MCGCQGGFSGGGGGGDTANPWHYIGNFDYEFFAADGLESDLILTALPANAVLEAVRVITTEEFANGGVVDFYNLRLGIFGSLDLYLEYYDAKAVDTLRTAFVFDEQDVAGWNVRVGVESNSSLDGFTAGAVDIWLKYWVVP